MDDEEGCEEGSQLETGFAPLEGECTGDGTPCRWQIGRMTPCGKLGSDTVCSASDQIWRGPERT